MKRRIGHFIESGIPGGAEQVLLDLCLLSKAHGDIPLVLHFDHPFFSSRCQQLEIEQIIIPKHIYRPFKSTRSLPLFAVKFGNFLKKNNIEILHSHLFGPITGGALAAAWAGIPHIGTLHDVHMITEKPSRIHLIKLATLLNSRLVSVSRDMEKFYRKQAKFSPSQLQTIYNGIDLPAQPASIEKQTLLRAEFNITPDNIVIICTGRLVGLKKIDVLIEAISILSDKSNIKLLIVGEGPEETNLRKRITSRQLDKYIVLTGFRNDISALLKASDIFVQCSSTEGLSRSILEAIASPLPCVLTRVGGNPELVQNGKNGFLVDVNDPLSLSRHIDKLCKNKTLRETFSLNALNIVKEKFLQKESFVKYEHLYQQVINK